MEDLVKEGVTEWDSVVINRFVGQEKAMSWIKKITTVPKKHKNINK